MKNLTKYFLTALLAFSIGLVGGAEGDVDLNNITIGNYDKGYEAGYELGYTKGYGDAANQVYKKGYDKGYEDAKQTAKIVKSWEENVKAESSVTVYITETGSKYHKGGCGYLHSSKIAIDLKKAKQRGYTACSRCY